MEYLTEQQRIAFKVQDIIDRGKEIREKIDPSLLRASDSAAEFINLVHRKGTMRDKKRTEKMRQAFEQNYKKLN